MAQGQKKWSIGPKSVTHHGIQIQYITNTRHKRSFILIVKLGLQDFKEGVYHILLFLSQLVVKCEPDQKHPMGFLHTWFLCGGNANGSPDDSQFMFGCDCQALSSNTSNVSTSTSRNRDSISTIMQDAVHAVLYLSNSPTAKRCIHFYSCLAVFLSDLTLSKEFSR